MGSSFPWPKQTQCAVSLTYDDGLPIHYSLVGPLLHDHGMYGTFYPMVQSDLAQHPQQWCQLARLGHELGNHSVFHPCRRTPVEEYPWLDEAYDLCAYSPARLRSELAVANFVLELIDGHTERTYGNTCCDTTIGRGEHELPMDDVLADLFVAARGALTNTIAQPDPTLNLMNVGCIAADGRSFADLIEVVEQARAYGGWAVLMIHGIGADTHDLHLDQETHTQFIQWLSQQRQTVWTAPFITVAKYITQHTQSDAA